MSDILNAARSLRDKLASDASLAKDRAEYLRTVANYNDAARLVEALESTVRPEPLLLVAEGTACSTEGCATP